MHQKNFLFILFAATILCNSANAMKRPREWEIASENQGNETQMIITPMVVIPKKYWDGVEPYDGATMIIKASTDHQCRVCNLWITNSTPALHAVEKHKDYYRALFAPRPTKKIKVESSEESSQDSSVEIRQRGPIYMEKTLKYGRVVKHVACNEEGCRFSSGRAEEIRKHAKLHEDMKIFGTIKAYYECSTCDFLTDVKRVFEKHRQRHLPKEERSNIVTCLKCGKGLSGKYSLVRHMTNQHS